MSDPFDPRRFGKTARNEQRKLFATTLNTVGLTVFGIGFLTPILTGSWDSRAYLTSIAACATATLLHLLAQRVLRDLEE